MSRGGAHGATLPAQEVRTGHGIWSIASLPDGRLATGHNGGDIRVWQLKPPVHSNATLKGHASFVCAETTLSPSPSPLRPPAQTPPSDLRFACACAQLAPLQRAADAPPACQGAALPWARFLRVEHAPRAGCAGCAGCARFLSLLLPYAALLPLLLLRGLAQQCGGTSSTKARGGETWRANEAAIINTIQFINLI